MERVTHYVIRTQVADEDEQIDRDDIDEPTLTFRDLRILLTLAKKGLKE